MLFILRHCTELVQQSRSICIYNVEENKKLAHLFLCNLIKKNNSFCIALNKNINLGNI